MMDTDCELYGHPNVTGSGCPCGRISLGPIPPLLSMAEIRAQNQAMPPQFHKQRIGRYRNPNPHRNGGGRRLTPRAYVVAPRTSPVVYP